MPELLQPMCILQVVKPMLTSQIFVRKILKTLFLSICEIREILNFYFYNEQVFFWISSTLDQCSTGWRKLFHSQAIPSPEITSP